MEKNIKSPRGIINSNPGNIRKSNDKWEGLRSEQTDPSFFQFISPAYGYRALLKVLINYNKLYGCKTIRDYISRWAPPSENDTESYIMSVCKDMGVGSDYELDVTNKSEMCRMAASISRVENGIPAVMADIQAGWDLL